MGHPGIVRMKALSRMYVWWPGISADIEKSVRLCHQCQEMQPTPPVAPLNPWRWPSRPRARLHLDFAGPFEGKYILIGIDAHSKWIEATCTQSTSSSAVIEVLRSLFARFGLPETIVTDNGAGFVSQEFEEFLRKNGVKYTTSAPYHPASNGLAERAVQIVKKGLKKEVSGTFSMRLAKVLFTYRITPQSTTSTSPAVLLLGRRPRTRLDLLKPNIAERVERKQEDPKTRHDKKAKSRTFHVGNHVFVKNFGAGNKWLPGQIVKMSGPVSFLVELEDGRCRRCHQDHLRHRVVEDGGPEMSQIMSDDGFAVGPSNRSTRQETTSESPSPQETGKSASSSTVTSTQLEAAETVTHRYPRRGRKPVERFEPGLT